MSSMADVMVTTLDNNDNVKLSPSNEEIIMINNSQIDNEFTMTNLASDTDEEDDGRQSSTTYVIQMDNKNDLIDIDVQERERLAYEHCDVGDDDESDNDKELDCYTSHIPLNNETEFSGESPISGGRFGAPVPTPIELGILSDDSDQTQDIKQRKYPVLPSIGRAFDDQQSQGDVSDDDPTINQLDYTREKMETEADFFADYRVNTSVVKPTPRTAPLPPIGQTYTPRTPRTPSSGE